MSGKLRGFYCTAPLPPAQPLEGTLSVTHSDSKAWADKPGFPTHVLAAKGRVKHLWLLKREVYSVSRTVGKAPDLGGSSGGDGQKAQLWSSQHHS